MKTTYRVDYEDHHGITHVIHDLTRERAMKLAHTRAQTYDSAYAIRTDDGKDVGQRVYSRGYSPYTDNVF